MALSGGLEAFDVDEHGLYARFWEAMHVADLLPLLERIEAGYHELTPRGDHLLYRCEALCANTKLAKRPKRPEEMQDANDKFKTLIETRGEGGYIITAPTYGPVNPDGVYELVSGGFGAIAVITADEREALCSVARTFDEMPRSVFREPILRRANEQLPDWEIRPGDHFAERPEWRDVLEPHGWRLHHQRNEEEFWARPGKTLGWSATTKVVDGKDLLYVFTTSSGFEAERAYSKFSAYAMLNHNRDYIAAAKKLAENGYGKRAESRLASDAPPTGIPA